MLDIRFIRDNAKRVQEASQQKGYQVDIAHLLQLDDERREVLLRVESLRQKRNEVASRMKGGKPAPEIIEEGKKLKTELAEQEDHLRVLEEEYLTVLKKVPNMPMADVPIGASEDENVVAKTWGELPTFNFAPKNHW